MATAATLKVVKASRKRFDADEVTAVLKKARVLELAITGLIADLGHSVPTNPHEALGPVESLAGELVDMLSDALEEACA
jgi:hypothetical protein